jgi:branched-chain amino acid transport system ATP-binding protein
MLEATGITKQYGGLRALGGVSIAVNPGEIVALIGPNGAGKSTMFEIISGLQSASGGQVTLDGEDVTELPPWTRSRMGIGRTFQIVRPLGGLTVLENVMTGAFTRRTNPPECRAYAEDVLDRVALAASIDEKASNLTLMQQKRLEIARAVATEPKYILLDECFAGLRAAEQTAAIELVGKLADDGLGLLLIEHSMPMVMRIAHRVVVLHHGEVLAQGAPDEIRRDESVIAAYLGKSHVDR